MVWNPLHHPKSAGRKLSASGCARLCSTRPNLPMAQKKFSVFAFAGVMAWLLASSAGIPHAVADDAFVLPKGVLRLTGGTSLITAKESYGNTGEKFALGATLGTTVQALVPALHPTSKVEISITRE